tara:strand:- start:821 stop:982 length:162 start_codon:yes stop_codon:yes gene_type:complete
VVSVSLRLRIESKGSDASEATRKRTHARKRMYENAVTPRAPSVSADDASNMKI